MVRSCKVVALVLLELSLAGAKRYLDEIHEYSIRQHSLTPNFNHGSSPLQTHSSEARGQPIHEHSFDEPMRRNAMYLDLNAIPSSSMLDVNETLNVSIHIAGTCSKPWDQVYTKIEHEPFSSGGFGKLYKVKLKTGGGRFAFKEVIKKRSTSQKEFDKVMQHEVTCGSVIAPFIMGFRDVFVVGPEQVSFAMPLMSGGDLIDDLDAGGSQKFEPKDPFSRMAQMAYGLWELHQQYIIYMDLKLENILLDNVDVPKIGNKAPVGTTVALADFGLSEKCTKDKIACVEISKGTPGYLAPTIVMGMKPYGPEVDWWSYACTVFAMHTGHEPFGHGSDYLHKIQHKLGVNGPLWKLLSKDLQKLFLKILHYDNFINFAYKRKEMVGGWDQVHRHPIMGDSFWLSAANSDFLGVLDMTPGLKPTQENLQQFWGKVCNMFAHPDQKCLCPEVHPFRVGDSFPRKCNPVASSCPGKEFCQSECTFQDF